ncbi:hypothetical protein [Bradyrhizobium sp. 145]|uniref:hypothetical protein n=1 Tax=Bradyrhizobium sp. 145 TaxID=2782621 RepID=UPI001FF90C51|nr:hypothetical protein [Bradyrhizobium sp. 145]MCK1685627.1 hypothetical protein [Bradyrhizobium sp. 145]
MTVASEVNRSGPYIGNGVTTNFNYGFRILDEAHIQVIRSQAGVDTVLTLGGDYTVSGVGNDAGGAITIAVAPTATQTITILRSVPFTQETDLENQGAYFAETIEAALDLSAMRDQELRERQDRAIRFSGSDPILGSELGSVATRKNKLLGFGTNGEIIYPLGPTFVGSTATGVANVDSRAAAQVTTFDASVNVVRTGGLAIPGDGGGAEYIRGVAGDPGAFQDAGGAYWKLAKTINPKIVTANYTISANDNGSVVKAGSGTTGLFTITLPPASSLFEGFTVTVKNGDTSRGKLLSGFPADFGTGSGILWPLQAGTVGIVDGAWAVLSNPGVWTPGTFIFFNVDHALGSNVNSDGLGTGAGAFATYQFAVDTALKNVYSPKRNITIAGPAAGEAFTEDVVITSTWGATSGIYLKGTPANPLNTAWQTTGQALVVHDNAFVLIDGFRLDGIGSGRTGLTAGKLSFIETFNMAYGTFTNGVHIVTNQGGFFNFGGGVYKVIGNAGYHINAAGGSVNLFGAAVNIAAGVSMTSWLIGSLNASIYTTATYSGSALLAGTKYQLFTGAVLELNGTTLPGPTAGTTDGGVQVKP